MMIQMKNDGLLCSRTRGLGSSTPSILPRNPYHHAQEHVSCRSISSSSSTNIGPCRRRWLVLASFSLLSFTNAWIWIAWSPFVKFCSTTLWDVEESRVDQLSSVYFYICLLVIFPALVMVQAYGLRYSLYLSSFLNFFGSLLRYLYLPHYRYVYLGTIACAVCSAFVMSLPTFISAEWFGTHERVTASTIGVLAEHLGIAAGLGATMVISVSYESVVHYTLAQCLLSAISLFAILIFVTDDRPSIPPSAAAAAKSKKRIVPSLQFTNLYTTTNITNNNNNNNKVITPPPSTTTPPTTTSSSLSSTPSMGLLHLGDTTISTIHCEDDNHHTTNTITTNIFNPYYLYRPLTSRTVDYDDTDDTDETDFRQDHAHPLANNNNLSSSNNNKWKRVILQAQHANDIFRDHKKTIGHLLSNTSVVLFAIVYGISVGVFDAICTFLSQYLPYDPQECGYVGLVFVLVGFLGSFLVAYYMDSSYTNRSIYWISTFSATLGCAISMIYLWLTVWLAVQSRFLVYSAIILNGICLSTLISAGFEYGAAITYPSDENVVSGLLNYFSHIIAWALIECKEYISPSSSSPSSSLSSNSTTAHDITTITDISSNTINNFFAYNAFLSALLIATCFLFYYFIQGESKRPLEEDWEDNVSQEEEVFIRQG